MVELADEYCGSSSMMPQKKNPWAVDWMRGAAGNAIGDFASCLGAMKGASSTDGSAQDYPEIPLAAALERASDNIGLLTGVLATLDVKGDVMLARAGASWATASNLADAIVRATGCSFRSAHGIVGRLVRHAVADGVSPDSVTGAMLDRAAVEITGAPVGFSDDVVRTALDPVQFVASRVTQGSVNPVEVQRMLKQCQGLVRQERRWLGARKSRTALARQQLDSLVDSLAPGSADRPSSERSSR
jgi:argininosuccinate lyase